jgi:hypothetical protein
MKQKTRWYLSLKPSLLAGAAVLLLSGHSALVQAATLSYFLDQSNQISVLPDGKDYLEVTLTSTGTAVDFKVDILSALTQYSGGSTQFGLDSFGFNTSGAASSITAANFSALPSTKWTVQTSINQNGFGQFDLIPQTNGANNRVSELTFALTPVASGGAKTIDQNLFDYIVLSGGHAGEGNEYFAAHVAGFTIKNSGVTSAYFGGTTPVPLPETGWLLLSGLAALVWLTRNVGPRDRWGSFGRIAPAV